MNLREYKKATKGMTPDQKTLYWNSLSLQTKLELNRRKKSSLNRKAMDIAAEMCGLKKVRGCVSGKIYYE